MRIVALLLTTWIGIALAWAGAGPNMLLQTLSPPGWVYDGAVLDYDFAGGRLWSQAYNHQSSLSFTGPINIFNVTHTSSGNFAQAMDGHWVSFAAAVPRITDQGFLIEEAETNTALWARDLTQSGTWTASNMTTALNATGIDNLANNATTLTATAGNATVLQSITLASQLNAYSVFLKRVSGSGNIQTTVDNGTTWTTCTIVSTAFTRCTVTKTAANPVIGIRIVTSGDSVIADFSQCENNFAATSPISTTSASGTRAIDTIQALSTPPFPFTNYWEGLPSGTIRMSIVNMLGPLTSNSSNAPRLLAASQGFSFTSTTVLNSTRATSTSVTIPNAATYITASAATGGLLVANAWDASGETVAANGATTTTAGTMTAPTGTTQLGNTGSTRGMNGYIQRITIWPTRLTAGGLVQLTTVP